MILIMMPLAVALGDRFGLLALQSGALRISAYRDFLPNPVPIPSTYSFRAFKPFYGDPKQPKQTKPDQCRTNKQTKSIYVLCMLEIVILRVWAQFDL